MTFKQPGAFTFTKVDVPGNVFEGNRIPVILFNIGKDTAQPVIIRAVFLDILWLIGNVRQKQPPHPLQANDHIQLIELRLFLIKGNDLKQMLTKCTMPGLTLINADTGKPWILKHRIYIPAVYSALKKVVNQSGIKGDRNVGAVLLIFHGTGMKDDTLTLSADVKPKEAGIVRRHHKIHSVYGDSETKPVVFNRKGRIDCKCYG